MLYAFKLGRKLRGEEPYCPEKGGKGGSSDKSAKYAAEAQKYAADLQNQQWQTIMKNLAPFSGRKNFSRRTLMLMRLVIAVLCVSWLLNIQTRLNPFVKAWDSLMKISVILSAP